MSAASAFGPYRVLEELGRGATAQVLLAADERTGEKAVLKVLLEPASLVHQKRFAREVKALRGLEHPNIVRVVESGVTDGHPWYAMERVERRPLDRVLRERWQIEGSSVRPGEARRALEDVGSALAFAHRRRVVHRDLKPSNVLVDAGFGATLIDFGIARMVAEEITKLTSTGDFLGTPAYAAPEQFEGGPADHRCDIYSFGLLAYEVLTGKLPFADLAPMEMIRRRSQDSIAPPGTLNPLVPAGLDRVVLRCLEPSPDGRYGSMDELLEDLQLAFTGGKPRAPAPARKAAPRPPARPRVARVATIAALAAVLGGAVVFSSRPLRAPPPEAGEPSAGRVDRLFVKPSHDSAVLEFRTPVPSLARVDVRAPGGDWIPESVEDRPSREHRATLAGLRPDTEYRYRIQLELPGGRRQVTDDQLLRTRPSP